jgi:hypothetical protein
MSIARMMKHAFALAALLLASVALAEDKIVEDKISEDPATLRELIDAAVNQIEVYSLDDDDTPAKPMVALRWANNSRGSEDGMTLLYIHKGRPIAAACLYPWTGNLIHDLEAIGRRPVVARRKGETENVWRPRTSGVEFIDIPDAPAPEASAAARLRQIKSLAEQFQSTMLGWKQDDTDREELRLLPRPLYRYATTEGPVIDGALFAFVMGTDPETLLLIEAVEEGGKSKWQYGFARRTSGHLEGRHRDKVVWTAARYPDSKDPLKPHFSVGTRIPPALLPEEK